MFKLTDWKFKHR